MENPRPGRSRFANMLKLLRELNDAMTQDELSEESGVAVELIQNYEQEKSFAKEANRQRLAEALAPALQLFMLSTCVATSLTRQTMRSTSLRSFCSKSPTPTT